MKKVFPCLLAGMMTVSLLLSACSKQEEGAPSGMKTASPDTVDYTLYVPTDWVVDTAEDSQLTSAHVSESDYSNITMMVYSNDGSYESEKEYFAAYLDQLTALFDLTEEGESSMELLVNGESGLMGNLACSRYLYTATLGGVDLQYLQAVSYYEGNFYIFTFTAYVDYYEKSIEDVESILSNISFGS